MKILFNTYPMAFHTPGGGEIQLLKYKEFLNNENIDTEFFNQWNPKLDKFDIVHFFSALSGSIHFTGFAKQLGLPVIVSPNLWITNETIENYPHGEIRSQFDMSDKIICNSDAECDLLSHLFTLPREKFKTVYNGIDDIFLEAIDENLFRDRFDIHEKYILNVANLEPRKNQLKLISAMKEFPDYKLVIIGHKRDEDYANKCLQLGGDQLIYIEPIVHESELLRSAYIGCEVFALPSLLETPGLAALEAAAIGAKILITSEGSTKEYFGEGATYVDPNSANSIIKGLDIAINKHFDYLLQFYIRVNFSWNKVLRSLIPIYEELLSDKKERNDFEDTRLFSIEKDSEGTFVWSNPTISFKNKNGRLKYSWRALSKGYVDIYINNILKYSQVPVYEHWTFFTFDILSESDISEIYIETHFTDSFESNDHRKLTLAIRELKYEKF